MRLEVFSVPLILKIAADYTKDRIIKNMKNYNLIRKSLFASLVLPWFLLTPILMRFELRSFHLEDTWSLSRDKRRIYFAKREFNAIGDKFDDDYFELIDRAYSIIFPNTSPFLWYTSENLSKTQNLRALIYTCFWLIPSVGPNDNDKIFYKVYYQREPDSTKEEIVEKINGKKPSYITKVVR